MTPHRRSVCALTLAFVGACLAPRPVAGQAPGLRFDVPPLRLGQPVVVALLEDRQGFIWVGTQGGLVRFDGHATVVFNAARNSEHPLPSNGIRDLLEDADGRIWVSTLNGLAILSADRDSVTAITAETLPELAGVTPAFTGLAQLPDGRVAAGLDAGGVVFFRPDGTVSEIDEPDPTDSTALHTGTVDDLLVAADGSLWAGTLDGLYVRAADRTDWRRIPLPPPAPGIANDEPRRLATSPDGTIWVGGLNGVIRVDPETLVARATRLGPFRVQSLLVTAPDSVWVGTYGNGLLLLDREARVRSAIRPNPSLPQSLLDGRVSALARDAGGLLWVGLWGNGVQTADPAGASFRLIPAGSELLGEEVTSIHPHPSGTQLLVTTYSGGVNVMSAEGRRLGRIDAGRMSALNDPAEVLTALWPRGGDLLVGTMRSVERVLPSGATRRYAHVPGDSLSLPDATVYDIEQDDAGRIWIGTNLGLRRFDPAAGTFHAAVTAPEGAGLRTAFVRDIHLGGDGWLWVATFGQGLFIFDPESGDTRHLDPERRPELPDAEIAAVTTLGPYGWFGTRSAGTLHRVVGWGSDATLRIERVGPPEGLGAAIQCLVPDRRDRLWGSTTSQIVGVDPGSLQLTVYGPADGVPHGEFRSASCGLGPDGRLWFGGQVGATVFDPDSLRRPASAARTVVSAATFGPIRDMGPLSDRVYEVPFRGGLVTFRIAVLDYRSPQTQSFSYRLNEGAWTSLGDQASVTFADLAPGRYTFQVRGRDAHGSLADPSEPVHFVVQTPVYLTGWFRTLTVLALAALVVALYRYRTETIRRHNAQLVREIDERQRLEAQGMLLEEQLRQSQKMEAIGRLTGGIAHDFNNILTVMMGNAELLLESGDEEEVEWRPLVGEIRQSGEVAANLVRQLLVYSRRQPLAPRRTDLVTLLRRMEALLQRSIGAHYEVVIDVVDDEAPVLLDANQMESAILNLAINARDAMPDGGRFRVSLRRRDVEEGDESGVPPGAWWLVTASDTGTGIPDDMLARIFEPFFTTKGVGQGSGLGLAMVHGFVEASGGHVRAESDEGEGSRFLLYLPVAGDES